MLGRSGSKLLITALITQAFCIGHVTFAAHLAKILIWKWEKVINIPHKNGIEFLKFNKYLVFLRTWLAFMLVYLEGKYFIVSRFNSTPAYASAVWRSAKDVSMYCKMILMWASFWFMKRCEFKSSHFSSQCFQYMRVVCPTALASPVFVTRSAFQRTACCSIPIFVWNFLSLS